MNKTGVSKITIGRLHNLGNYEHVRYEVTVDVAEGDNAANVLINLEFLLDEMQAGTKWSAHGISEAKRVLALPEAELGEYNLANLNHYREIVSDELAALDRRKRARERFNELNGAEVFTDAKEKWEDDY